MSNRILLAAESATCGQPDKLCDVLVDSILDTVLADDRFARVDLDAAVTRGMVFLAGEITTKSFVHLENETRRILSEAGYTDAETNFVASSVAVLSIIGEQSREVALTVDNKGAGNQCVCVGYASNEGRRMGLDIDLIPFPIWLAHRLTRRLEIAQRSDRYAALFPDGTSQVVVEYADGLPVSVLDVSVACHHRASVALAAVQSRIMAEVIDPILAELPPELVAQTRRRANHAGPFTVGGPAADLGQSARKGVSDNYGTACAFGGSSAVGKDPTKTDRAALYMARYLAKNVVLADLADRAEISLIYQFGERLPVSVQVNTFGTGRAPDAHIAKALREAVDLSCAGIVETLDLRRVKYEPFACGGYFGRTDQSAPWERGDLAPRLQTAID